MADVLPVFSACVGDALDDAGFGDVGGLGAEDAVNCLAYYGIVVGKTQDRFDPAGLVTRSQLALMLHRAAKIAGLDLQGDGATGFDDITGLGEERRNAIGVLTQHLILAGTTASMFEPNRPATRLEIVSALIRLLRLMNPALFNPDGSLKLAANRIDYFDDTRTDLLQTDDDLVSYAYEMGLTTGSAGDRSMFDPDGTVPRKHAAAFITRMLAHTNVRPEGLTAQADGRTIVVSVRDSKFQPVPAQVIDGFYADTSDQAEAFDDQGACTAKVNPIKRGTTKCRTDTADPKTDAKGNAELTIPNTAGRNITIWTWSDKIGTTLDQDTTTYKLQLPN